MTHRNERSSKKLAGFLIAGVATFAVAMALLAHAGQSIDDGGTNAPASSGSDTNSVPSTNAPASGTNAAFGASPIPTTA